MKYIQSSFILALLMGATSAMSIKALEEMGASSAVSLSLETLEQISGEDGDKKAPLPPEKVHNLLPTHA
jgi:hypothetical protein